MALPTRVESLIAFRDSGRFTSADPIILGVTRHLGEAN